MKFSILILPKYKEKFLFLAAFTLFFCASLYGQTNSPLWGTLPAGKYQVGFKVIEESDGSRSFPRKSGANFISVSRPIRISVWYPAAASKSAKSRMRFQDYLKAMGDDSSDAVAGESAVVQLKQSKFKDLPLFQEFSDAALYELLGTQTAAVRNASFAAGEKFPVVVLGQGLYYESPVTHSILCEFLASHGFIVATTELVGAHSPFAKLDAVDLEAAVRDLEFVASRARNLPNADKEKLAVVGFDMGGLAGLILTMRNADVDAYASLDSGISAAHNLRLVKSMPDYDPARLRAPILHATHPVEELARFGISEDTSFLDAARFSDRLILRFPNTRHADFTSVPVVESVAAKMQDEATTRRRRSFETIVQNLQRFLQAHLQNDRRSFNALYNRAKENSISSTEVEFISERNTASARIPISEAEFINRLYSDGAEKAAVVFRKMRTEFPDVQIFREETLNQIGFNRLYRGATNEAILIFNMNVEAFPKSAGVYDGLGTAYMLSGKKDEAIRNFRKSLELNPNNESAKARLKQLAGDKK